MTGKNKKIGMVSGAVVLLMLAFSLIKASDGGEIFREEGCSGCHSFKGQGGSLAPDLTAVTQRRSNKWIWDQIRNPQKHHPGSMMPSFDHLSWVEMVALIRYLNRS